MLPFLVVTAAVGAGLSYAIVWLPVLLLGILLFLGVLICTAPSAGLWPALGYGALSVATLEISYIIAGFLFGRSDRLPSTSSIFRRGKHAHASKHAHANKHAHAKK